MRTLSDSSSNPSFFISASNSSRMPGIDRSASERARPQVGIAGHAMLRFRTGALLRPRNAVLVQHPFEGR